MSGIPLSRGPGRSMEVRRGVRTSRFDRSSRSWPSHSSAAVPSRVRRRVPRRWSSGSRTSTASRPRTPSPRSATSPCSKTAPSGSFNSIEPLFVGFAADGEVLDAHGRVGGGPDEYTAVAGLVVGGIDGEAWAFDSGRHGLAVASQRRGTRADVPFPRDAIPPRSVLPGMSLFLETRSGRPDWGTTLSFPGGSDRVSCRPSRPGHPSSMPSSSP